MTWFFTFPDALQGSLLFTARIIVGVSMIGLIGWAILAVRARDFNRHGALMLRAYALGQGASTQALFGIGWIGIIGAEPAGLPRDLLMVLCWVLNLLAAEILIQRSMINPQSARSDLDRPAQSKAVIASRSNSS